MKVIVFHNTTVDADGRHPAFLDGYQPGHRLTRVFECDLTYPEYVPAVSVQATVYRMFNADECTIALIPHDLRGPVRDYRRRGLRSLSIGDAVAIGPEVRAVGPGSAWQRITGPVIEDLVGEPGSTPLYPPPSCTVTVDAAELHARCY